VFRSNLSPRNYVGFGGFCFSGVAASLFCVGQFRGSVLAHANTSDAAISASASCGKNVAVIRLRNVALKPPITHCCLVGSVIIPFLAGRFRYSPHSFYQNGPKPREQRFQEP